MSGKRKNSNGATTVAGASINAVVIQKCAVSPPILIIEIQYMDVFFGIAMSPSIPAKKRLIKNCIMVNQNKIQVTDCLLVKSLVARTLPANPIAQKIAAIIPVDSPSASGRAIIKIPVNPMQVMKKLSFVNFSFKKRGAINATHKGAVNSKANSCAKVTCVTAKYHNVCPKKWLTFLII